MPKMPKNTVFVVGAGASEEADLPTSNDLKKEISSLLDIRLNEYNHRLECGDDTILKALTLHVRQPDGSSSDINPYLQEAQNISGALPTAISIDNYIDQHRGNKKIELCGKLAIVRSILDAEKGSLLDFEMERADTNIDFNALEKTWYISFFKLLTENCTKDELKERFESITLIIFNYDRCIEHFLYYALQKHYRLSTKEAAKLVKNINIYHPYGSVGTLPWINPNGAVAFGSKPNHEQLLNLVKQIKTFAEGTDPNLSEIGEIHKHMEVANRLVFMGFAFHKPNMQLISPGREGGNTRRIECYATTFKISKSDKEVVEKQIVALYRLNERGPVRFNMRMADLECGPFFLEFWRSLAF